MFKEMILQASYRTTLPRAQTTSLVGVVFDNIGYFYWAGRKSEISRIVLISR